MIGSATASSRERRRAILDRALRYLLIAGLTLVTVAVLHYFTDRHVEQVTRDAREQLNAELGRIAIDRTLGGVVGDLLYLAELGQSRMLFDPQIPGSRDALAEGFRIFAKRKRIYDQMRFLDLRGVELVRVNFAAGTAVVVPEAELQKKDDRYYFQESVRLTPGEVYISPLDLNIEHGQVEQPLKSMMRFATPVTDRDGAKAGVLILNYLGDTLLHSFRTAVANIGEHAMLVNGSGYWLSSPNRDDEWGFALKHGRSFAAAHPDAWQRIASEERGRFMASDGVYTFVTVRPALAARAGQVPAGGAALHPRNDERWKIVSRLSPHALAGAPTHFLLRYSWLYAVLFSLAAVAAFFLAQATVRRRMAEAQAAFGRRFREILENMSLLAIGLDRDGRIVFSNDALSTLVGHSREALAGRNWVDALVLEEHRERSRELFERMVFTRDYLPRHEFAIRTAAGATRLIAWSTARLTDAEGDVVGVTCIGEDITEARRAEQELRKVSRAVEQSPSTVMIADIKGRIEYVNPKFTQLTGYTLEEVRGRNPRILKSGETSPEEYRKLWETVTSGGEWRGVFHNRKKSGELYWEAACISPIRDASGEITHLLAVKEDITERRQLEEEVERRKRDAARNQALAEVGRMANMVAHDLRNPLSSVKMTLQIYGRRPAKRWDPEERELQQIALEQVHYMEEILSDLLTYSRPDSLDPEWIDIDRVLDGAILVAQKHVTEHGVQIRTRYRPGLPKIYGDGAKLRQAFANILENAAQATAGIVGREPEVDIATELELREDGPWVRIEICDNGAGVASDDVERVFEPFYTTRARGTGLGLAIVRRMVELHGGTARLQQVGRTRTCATVLLPTRAKGEPSAEGQGSHAAETHGAGAAWTLDGTVTEH